MSAAATPPDVEPNPDLVVYTIGEVASILKISTRHAYTLVTRGDIDSVRLGKRIVVPAWALRKVVGDGTAA